VNNVEVSQGLPEDIPLPDASVDVVISNCVVNLADDKNVVLAEAVRLLPIGGRLAFSDVIADEGTDEITKADMAEWTGCASRAPSPRPGLPRPSPPRGSPTSRSAPPTGCTRTPRLRPPHLAMTERSDSALRHRWRESETAPRAFQAATKKPPTTDPSDGVCPQIPVRLLSRRTLFKEIDMRYLRRLIAVLVSCATWFLAASSVAYAMRVDDPGAAGSPVITEPNGTPLWQFLAFATVGVLAAVAITGLGHWLSRPPRAESSPRSPQLRA
jgi:SAM-dependent methyltransferase